MEINNYNEAAQLARSCGFEFYDTCNCGGTLKHNYKKAGYYLELLPNKKMFILKVNDKKGKTLFTGKFNVLEKQLNEIK